MLVKNPKISVVIPTFNRASVITRAIMSVQKQTYQDFEIIVVDDGSTDNTENVIQNLNDNRITFIKHGINRNGAVARNTGIDAAIGKYIAFLDSDDEWLPEKLEIQINELQKVNDNVNVVCYSQLFFNNRDSNERRVLPARGIYKEELIDEYLFVNDGLIQTSTLMVPKLLLNKVKFNPKLIRHQDWDLCIQLFKTGVQFHYINEPLVEWHHEKKLQRVSTSKDYKFSVRWINSYKDEITNNSYEAFIEKYVITQIFFEDELNKKRQMLNDIIEDNKVAIYGAGYTTQHILEKLTEEQKKQIVALIDQSKDKHGKKVEGVQVYNPSEINNLGIETVVVSVQNFKTSKAICKDLLKYNKNIINLSEYLYKY